MLPHRYCHPTHTTTRMAEGGSLVQVSRSFQARRELLVRVAGRYRDATGPQKSQILDEFVAITGYARKYAIRLLTQPGLPPVQPLSRPRARRYGLEVQVALEPTFRSLSHRLCRVLRTALPGVRPPARAGAPDQPDRAGAVHPGAGTRPGSRPRNTGRSSASSADRSAV